jgi:hypothetical protein
MTTKSSGRRSVGGRNVLQALALAMLPAWGLLLLFTRFVSPQSIGSFTLFFLLLGLALFCTLVPSLYLLTHWIIAPHRYRASIRHATRQAGLIDLWVLFNLLLRLFHSWNIFTAAISFAIVVVLELLALGHN